jgi:heat shock protein HslJ
MRKLTMIALGVAIAAVIAACSNSGSGLTGKTWQLTAITELVPAFQGVVPAADQVNYTIEFKSDGTYNAKADCNTTSGAYTTTASGGLTILPGPTTLVACPEGSLSSQYLTALGNAASYAVASSQLTITLKDGGTLAYK